MIHAGHEVLVESSDLPESTGGLLYPARVHRMLEQRGVLATGSSPVPRPRCPFWCRGRDEALAPAMFTDILLCSIDCGKRQLDASQFQDV